MSQDEIRVKIELLGLGSINTLIIRHLGPFSAEAILDKMPFVLRERFGFGSKKYWMLLNVGIFKGPDSKAKPNLKRGDIAYNVIDVEHDSVLIAKAIQQAIYDRDFEKKVESSVSPYGDGHASERIISILKSLELNDRLLRKKWPEKDSITLK